MVTEVADRDGWRAVRDTLIANTGSNTLPVIRVIDGDRQGRRTLVIEHAHDGRDLHPEYTEKTLQFVHRLWQNEVILETSLGEKKSHLVHNDRGFSIRAA